MANKDDLLNLNNNKKNIKKPLIYGAIAFLVFIIAILGFAIYNNTASKQENVVLPPQIKQEKQQETMFKEVPIEKENNTTQNNKQNVAAKLVQSEKNTETNNTAKTPVKETEKEQKNVINQVNKKTEKPQVQTKAQKRKAVKTQKAEGKYYVQVAALMKYKKPNRKFLEIIKKEGYKYTLYRTYYIKNGKKVEITKILIGPFTKTKVKSELRKIKNTITQNAFIYKVK